MKKILKLLHFIVLIAVFFASCKKDQNIDYYNGGTPPILTASLATSSAIPLTFLTASQNAVSFSWTNPNYQFTTGVSSQNVTYLMEIDTLGANFTNPNRQSISINPDLSLALTQTTLNSYLLNTLLLKAGIAHTIQIRITSSINSVTATNLISNILQYTVTPYSIPPAVALPTSGQLFLVGGDTKIGAWSNPVPTPAQQFTQVSPTEYKLTIALSGGDPTQGSNQFLILPVNGSWTNKYACVAANNTSAGGTFGYNLNDNFPGPLVAGNYLIDVNFQTGKYTVTKQ